MACLATGTVAREGSFEGGEGTRAEVKICQKLGGLQKLALQWWWWWWFFFWKLWAVGSKERMWVMSGLVGSDRMR